MSTNEYFKRNRYTKENLFNGFKKVELLENVIYVDAKGDNKIEIYLKDVYSYNKEYIKEILENVELFDDFVQNYCEKNYKNGEFDFKAYAVELSWISIKEDKVTIRYWGKYVNIELEVIFIKKNNEWMNENIYYC